MKVHRKSKWNKIANGWGRWRSHHNNKGTATIKSGGCHKSLKIIAQKLGIEYQDNGGCNGIQSDFQE